MSGLIDPGEVRVQSLRKWSLNGLDEFVLGVFFCALAAIYLPERTPTKMTFFGQNYAMIAPFLQMACCLTMALTLKKLRAKLIFPRTGYVEFRRGKSQKWMIVASMFVGLAMVGGVFAAFSGQLHFPDMSRAAGPALALVLAACFVSGGITYRLPHLHWLAGWSLVLGAVADAMDAKIEGVMWIMVGVGATMAVSGAVRLKSFLQTHPIVQNDAIGGDHA